jgi:hypothetical protein
MKLIFKIAYYNIITISLPVNWFFSGCTDGCKEIMCML